MSSVFPWTQSALPGFSSPHTAPTPGRGNTLLKRNEEDLTLILFARLAGAAPLPASSGNRIRHRLDRGADRRLNRALHTILLTHRPLDAATRAYVARRLAEGTSEREAVRCLKRYLARSLFRLLENPPSTP